MTHVPDNIRQELLRLCKESRSRTSVFSREAPTHWVPWKLYDPETGEAFTVNGAWLFIERALANGCQLQTIELDRPKGKTGYWFHGTDPFGTRIYVKLQLGSGLIIGRSFHEG